MNISLRLILGCCLLSVVHSAAATGIVPVPSADPHYTKVGFFDIHVCNWPNRPMFFLILFSSYEHQNVKKVEIYRPTGDSIGTLDLTKYRYIKAQKGKPDKKVFLKHFDIPSQRENGWYSARITMNNGRVYAAEDYVVLRKMELAKNRVPKADAEGIKAPAKLTWDPVPGAKFYQVFLRDIWNEKTVLESKLLSKPELKIKPGLLQPGGYYTWRVHARDSNETVLLGDFNHGSLAAPITFSIAE